MGLVKEMIRFRPRRGAKHQERVKAPQFGDACDPKTPLTSSIMSISIIHASKAFRLVASVSLALLATVSVGCHSVDEQAEVVETKSLEITFKEQDARLLANRMRGFGLDDLKVSIQAPDSETWTVAGPPRDVWLVQLLARSLDSTLFTQEHVVRTYEIEHRDARLLANEIRGGAPLDLHVGVLASSDGTWFVIVHQEKIEAFESWLAEIDSPDLQLTPGSDSESV